MPRRPLTGVRVLDLSRLLPGPLCSLILSELGAEVIKVEDTGAGDYFRNLPPQQGGLGGAFYALNRGKRSISVDLKAPAGRELLLRLLPRCRVVIEGFRPGVMDRLGLGFEALREVNPEIILCSITGFGQTGPLAGRAGHDINFLALSGVLAAGGTPDGPPGLPGIQVADVAGGALWAAIRVLAALQGGGGGHLDVSMTEGTMAFLLPWIGDMMFGGRPLARGEDMLNGGLANYNTYRTSDGKHVAVGALEPKFWDALQGALGLEAGAGEPGEPRIARQSSELVERLGQRFAAGTRARWAEELGRVDACADPVLEMDELAGHPQHRARGCFFTLEDPERGPLTQLRLPLDGEPRQEPAPRQGEHTDQVLAEAGLAGEEI